MILIYLREINSTENETLRVIIRDYLDFFSNNKYNVGKINIEPQ